MVCPECGLKNRRDAVFCAHCGILLINICHSCGKTNIPEAIFCSACGTSLKDASEMSKLVAMAKNHDEAAITRLYGMTKSRYMATCSEILKNTKTTGDMEDVLQEAYIKIFTNLDSLQNPDQFVSWGSRIVTNTAIDLLRKKSPVLMEDNALAENANYEPLYISAEMIRTPEDVVDQKEVSRIVGEMIRELPEDQRLCIYLFYMQNMSVKDIASEAGVSVNTVKSRLKYGRSHIEKKVLLLEKQGTKLYGMAPLPFFLWIYRLYMLQSETAAVVSAGVRAGVLAKTTAEVKGVASSAAAGATSSGSAGTGTVQTVKTAGKAGVKRLAKKAAETAAKKTVKAAVSVAGKMGAGVSVKVVAGITGAAVLVAGTSAAVKTINNRHITTKEMKAYAAVMDDLLEQYGEPQVQKTQEDYGDLYLEGLCAAGLADFDNDGNDDLIAVYSTGEMNGVGISADETIPGKDGYAIEIWSYKDKEARLLLSTRETGEYQSFFTDNDMRWVENVCAFSINEDPQRKNYLQLYTQPAGRENGFSLKNIYYSDAESESEYETVSGYVSLTDYYWDGSFYKNGEIIEKEQWMDEAVPRRVLFAATLSGEYDNSGSGWDATNFHGVETVASHVYETINYLKGEKPAEAAGDEEWMSLYLKLLMECNILKHTYTIYSDRDLNTDYFEEMKEIAYTPAELNEYLNSGTLDGKKAEEVIYSRLQEMGADVSFDESTHQITRHIHDDTEWGDFDYELEIEPRNYQWNYEYALHDMDQDGIPELIICERSTEAGASCHVYSVKEGKVIHCGHLSYAHTRFRIGTGEGLVSSWAHMGSRGDSVVRLENGIVSEEEAIDEDEADQYYPHELWTYPTEDLYAFWSYSKG